MENRDFLFREDNGIGDELKRMRLYLQVEKEAKMIENKIKGKRGREGLEEFEILGKGLKGQKRQRKVQIPKKREKKEKELSKKSKDAIEAIRMKYRVSKTEVFRLAELE
jgi:hypothetical protein